MFTFSFLAILAFAATTLACDYTEFGASHTMCKYGTGCTKSKSGLTKAEKTAALNIHNELRQKVASGNQKGQPSASNMNELIWDDELAMIAQKWADQCKFGHDENRKSKKYDYCGQNVYIFWSSWQTDSFRMTEAVQSWYNEVEKPGFDSKNISPFKFTSGTGHYTQLVWASTKAIGCGGAMYKDKDMFTQLIVCNYGPGGNIIGSTMYETGKQCSKCKTCSKTNNALCSS